MASWTNGWWRDGENGDEMDRWAPQTMDPSNSITTALIHSLMAHLLILAPLGRRGQEGFARKGGQKGQ